MVFRFLSTAFFGFVMMLNQAYASEKFENGLHYETLAKPVVTADPAKVEVLELFWYGCSHCDALDPSLRVWASELPSDVSFFRRPVVFGQTWEMHARIFWVAKNLGILDTVHESVFNALHRHGRKLQYEADVIRFFEKFGAEPAVVKRELNSFSTESAMRLTEARTRIYGIRGVPAFVVDGRYVTGVSQAGGEQNLFKLLNQLIDKSRKQK